MTGYKSKKKAAEDKMSNKDSGGWPKMQQGTHLTVKTFEDGRTELVWDDEQLLKEVREAISSIDSTVESIPKKRKKKE